MRQAGSCLLQCYCSSLHLTRVVTDPSNEGIFRQAVPKLRSCLFRHGTATTGFSEAPSLTSRKGPRYRSWREAVQTSWSHPGSASQLTLLWPFVLLLRPWEAWGFFITQTRNCRVTASYGPFTANYNLYGPIMTSTVSLFCPYDNLSLTWEI